MAVENEKVASNSASLVCTWIPRSVLALETSVAALDSAMLLVHLLVEHRLVLKAKGLRETIKRSLC